MELPNSYYEWTGFVDAFDVDWSNYGIPGACLGGGYYSRLLLRASGPLFLIVLVAVLSFICSVVQLLAAAEVPEQVKDKRKVWKIALVNTLPFVLFFCFCLCAPTASAIFKVWDCSEYIEDSIGEVSGSRFLRADVRLTCDTFVGASSTPTDEYLRVTSLAWPFVLIWSLLMPVLFLAVLVPSRKTIIERRSTRLVRATAFLHREYEPEFFWWEPIYIFQRLIIVGWVQFIPREAEYGRLLIGTTMSILWLSVLLTQKPYKRDDMNHFSSILQVLLVLLFTASQSVYLFRKLELYYESESTFRILGFRSLDEIVVMMISFNLLVLAAFLAMLVYQAMTHRVVDSFRLVSSRQPPELTLARRMHYHVFLSHIWSSAQDQVAVIKRQLLLLMPGISVFLDVLFSMSKGRSSV